ncbi:hypothetical protein HDU91_004356, partial [Kappamyces sp. JEL0680]
LKRTQEKVRQLEESKHRTRPFGAMRDSVGSLYSLRGSLKTNDHDTPRSSVATLHTPSGSGATDASVRHSRRMSGDLAAETRDVGTDKLTKPRRKGRGLNRVVQTLSAWLERLSLSST